MARAYETLKTYIAAIKAFVSFLYVVASFWTAGYASLSNVVPSWLIYGLCFLFVILGLYGLWRSRKMAFLSPGFLLITIFVALTIEGILTSAIEQMLAASLLLLVIIYLIELGSSSILLTRIVHNMREPVSSLTISQMEKALNRYFIRLTSTVTAAFLLSVLLYILGAVTAVALKPTYAIAIAIVALLTSLVLLGTNSANKQ